MNKNNLDKTEISTIGSMRLYCDKKATVNIVHNLLQHDRTKHVEIDKHFIKKKLRKGLICTSFLKTEDQLSDILTKRIASKPFYHLVSKLGMRDIFTLA